MRSIIAAIAAILAASLVFGAGCSDSAFADRHDAGPEGAPSVVVVVLPPETRVRQLERMEELSVGLLGAGIGGNVSTAQTYLDISQGARLFNHFYEDELPPFLLDDEGVDPHRWAEIEERARSAPGEIVPGLLAAEIEAAGIDAAAESGIGHPALLAADRAGRVERLPAGACDSGGCGPGLSVIRKTLGELPGLIGQLRGDDLLIAFRGPPAARGLQLPIGVAGRGFRGTLTSPSTRTEGFVISTDIAPTILSRMGLEIPAPMSGSRMRAEGGVDVAALEALDRRLGERPERGAVIGIPVLAWLVATGLAAWLGGRVGARRALALLALSGIYLPALLLVGAALKPSEPVEALVVGVGAPLIALLTLALVPGYAALAVAAAVTVGAHAIDVVVGSPLTSLSVLGPNPAGGVRFFGIGNELEAAIGALVPLGVGAGLSARSRRSPRAEAVAFAAFAALAALAFAPGRFGADVGAAFVLAGGAVVAVSVVLGLGRRRAALAFVVVSALALAALVAVDLVLGSDAHFSRSVLGAEGVGQLGDVVERRLRLTLRSFTNPAYPLLLLMTLITLALGFRRRRRIMSWFGDREPARAGFLAALAGTALGTVANDSGAILLIIGTIFIAISAGFFWARSPQQSGS